MLEILMSEEELYYCTSIAYCVAPESGLYKGFCGAPNTGTRRG